MARLIYPSLQEPPIVPKTGNGGLQADWYMKLSEPVWPKKGLAPHQHPAFEVDPNLLTQPEAVSIDKWMQPLSEPVRLPKRLHAALNPSLFSRAFNSGDIAKIDWFMPLSLPVWHLPRLEAALQRAHTIDPRILTQPEAVSIDKWLQPLSLPTRRRWRIGSSLGTGRENNRSELVPKLN